MDGRLEDNRPEWARRALRDDGIAAADRYGVWVSESAYISADGREVPVSQVMLAHRDGPVRSTSIR